MQHNPEIVILHLSVICSVRFFNVFYFPWRCCSITENHRAEFQAEETTAPSRADDIVSYCGVGPRAHETSLTSDKQ